MAVSNAAYRIIKKAILIRIKNGENLTDVIASYTKLSLEQQEQMFEEISSEIGVGE